MVTKEQFHKELREKLGGDVSPNENCCPHYRYYLPSDVECPYDSHPQRLFWTCERDFHRVYGCHDGCRSYLDLWAAWEANRNWVGPEQYVDAPVADWLLAFWLMGEYDQYCPDGEFDLKAYFTLDNRGGRPCQNRMNTSVEREECRKSMLLGKESEGDGTYEKAQEIHEADKPFDDIRLNRLIFQSFRKKSPNHCLKRGDLV